MKLIVKERAGKKFYDEFIYVTTNYKKFLANPVKKAHGISKDAIFYGLFSLVALIAFITLYVVDKSFKLTIVVIVIFAIAFLISIFYYFLIINRIKAYRMVKGIVSVELDEKGIKYEFGDAKLEVLWKDISYIIINKYSISILPAIENIPCMGIEVSYKNKVIEAVKKYKKEDLIVNNID